MSGLVGLRNGHALGVFLVFLVVALILVGLNPARAQFEDTLITRVDAGSGSVSPNCPSGCLEAGGDIVTVTALPSVGWQFSSWSTQNVGLCIGGSTSNPCDTVMPALGGFTLTIGATFTQLPTTATTTAPPIPEYPIGLPLLAILAIIVYGVVRRRIRN